MKNGKNTFMGNLKYLFRKTESTLGDVQKATDISKSTLHRWKEEGRVWETILKLKKLAKHFNVSIDELFSEDFNTHYKNRPINAKPFELEKIPSNDSPKNKTSELP